MSACRNSVIGTGGIINEIAGTSKINQLNGVAITGGTITNATVSGLSGLTAADIPTLAYLSTSGGSLSGALGIGTTSPSDLFALNGAAYLADIAVPPVTTNRLYANSGSLYWAGNLLGGATTGNWSSDGTNVWRTGGNVGIGTTSPGQALSVQGNGLFSGALSATSLAALTATTTNLAATNATSTNLSASLANITSGIFNLLTASMANITGLIATNATTTNLVTTNATSTNLFATNGLFGSLSLTSPLSIVSGGIGTSTQPSANQLLLSDANGKWEYISTSTLGIVSGVSSVSNADGSLTVTPAGGNVFASLTLANANTWSGTQTFTNVITTNATKSNFADTGAAYFSGNVGIGTTTPNYRLDVRGATSFGGSSANLSSLGSGYLTPLENTGKVLVGWNETGGGGEDDLIANRGAGSVGGFNFYDYSNSGALTNLLTITGAGNVGIGTANPSSASLLTISTPANSTMQGLKETQTGAGTSNASFNFNSLAINSDDIAVTGGKSDAFLIVHQYGDATTTGGRNSFEVASYLINPTSPSNPDRNYVAIQADAKAFAGDHGTDPVTDPKGAVFAYGGQAVATTTATNLLELAGGEINVGALTGSSMKYKTLWSLASNPNDAVHGSVYDAMLSLSGQTGSVGWNDGILFGPQNGVFPIDVGGTLLRTIGGSITNGINIKNSTISGFALASPGFSVDGSGNVVANNFFSSSTNALTAGGTSALASYINTLSNAGETAFGYQALLNATSSTLDTAIGY